MTAIEAPSLRARWARLPWWAQVLAVYAASRVWTTLAFLVAARDQGSNPWATPQPSYSQLVGLFWDAGWYQRIPADGYPTQLPTVDGHVVAVQSAWAFFPLYPYLVKALMVVTGLAWEVVAPTLSLLIGAAALLVVHRVMAVVGARRGLPAELPLVTVALTATFVSAPVLQVAYTESLALLLVAGTLYLLVTRRYGWAIPVVVALGFTRAVAAPMALVVLVHAALRWRQWRAQRAARAGREGEAAADPLPRGEGARLAALLVAAAAAGVAWPAICGLVTGVPDAYLRTQGAWRSGSVRPVVPWLEGPTLLFDAATAPLVSLGALALLAALALSRSARRLGPELWTWAAGYVAYLVVIGEPNTSVIRFLLLAFPFGAAAAGLSRRRAWVLLLVIGGLAAQVGWVHEIWRLTYRTGLVP